MARHGLCFARHTEWPFLDRIGFGCSTPRASASAFCSHQAPPPHTRQGGQEYQYEIKDKLIRVSRPWAIDHPLRKAETMSGGVKVLPCESGKVVGTRPREQGAFPVIRHFIWRNQTNTDAVKCRWAGTRLLGQTSPCGCTDPGNE